MAFWGVVLIMCCKLGRSILLEEAMARVDAKLISSSRPMVGVQKDGSGLGVFWEALSRGPCWALGFWLCFLELSVSLQASLVDYRLPTSESRVASLL